MKKLAFSREAISNLKQIYDHTKKHFSEDKAEEVLEEVFQKMSSLSKFPYLGKNSEISDLVRELTIAGNTIYYLITEESVDIVFIKPRKTVKSLK